MVNPLIIPTFLNASNAITVGCWGQNPPGEPQLVPLTYKVCREAIMSVPMGGQSLKPITFGRSAEAGFQVPAHWEFENCAVEIDVVEDGDEERATFAAILKRAFDLAIECVIRPPHFGGRSFIGQDEKLVVCILESESGPSSQQRRSSSKGTSFHRS